MTLVSSRCRPVHKIGLVKCPLCGRPVREGDYDPEFGCGECAIMEELEK